MTDQPIDFDQLAKDVATQHANSPEGVQARVHRDVVNSLISRPKRTAPTKSFGTRFLEGAGLPGTWQGLKDQYTSPNPGVNPLFNLAVPGIGAAMQLPGMFQTMGAESGQQLGEAVDAFQQGNYGQAAIHGAASYMPGTWAPPLAEGDVAGALGRGTAAALPYAGEFAKAVVPEQFKFDLINKALGQGAIDPVYRKDAGRGLSRSVQGAMTQGSQAQPSADIHEATGLPAGTQRALAEASNAKNNVLLTKEGQAKTISVKDIIEENFGKGSLGVNLQGQPKVSAETATNVPESVGDQFSDFGTRLFEELQKRSMQSGGMLSAADIEQMRHEGIIDPEFGKGSTNAPELSLNAKAIRVSSDLIKRAENAVRGAGGESALEYLNTHLSDLSHAKEQIGQKLAASRSASTNPTKMNIKIGGVRTPISAEMNTPQPTGFNKGKVSTFLRTGLASLLSDKPWWLTDSTQGLTPQMQGPNPPIQATATRIPPKLLGPGNPPNTPPSAPGAPPSPNQPLGGLGIPKTPQAPQEAPGASVMPTHVQEGQNVAGFDKEGNLVSGNLTKMFKIGNDWHGLVLDLNKGRAVAIPAEELRGVKEAPSRDPFTHPKADRPPGTEPSGIFGNNPQRFKIFDRDTGAITGYAEDEGTAQRMVQGGTGKPGRGLDYINTDSYNTPQEKQAAITDLLKRIEAEDWQQRLENFSEGLAKSNPDRYGHLAKVQDIASKKKIDKPPGTSGEGVFGDTPTLGPERLADVLSRFNNARPLENMAATDKQGSPFVDDFVRNQVGRHLGYNPRTEGQHPGRMEMLQHGDYSGLKELTSNTPREVGPDLNRAMDTRAAMIKGGRNEVSESYQRMATESAEHLNDLIQTIKSLKKKGPKKPGGTEPAGIAGGPPIGPDQPSPDAHQYAHIKGARAYMEAKFAGLTPEQAQAKYDEAYQKGLGEFKSSRENTQTPPPTEDADANSFMENLDKTRGESLESRLHNLGELLRNRQSSRGNRWGNPLEWKDPEGRSPNITPRAWEKIKAWGEQNLSPLKPYKSTTTGRIHPGEWEVFDPLSGATLGFTNTVDEANALAGVYDLHYEALDKTPPKEHRYSPASDFAHVEESEQDLQDLVHNTPDSNMALKLRIHRPEPLEPYESQVVGNEWDDLMKSPSEFFEKSMTQLPSKYKPLENTGKLPPWMKPQI